jgi:Ser/Thr protein kinase RdoA (MazF antagonist)
VRADVAEGRLITRVDPAAVRSICRSGADFSSTDARQPLHGDLHLSNILMPVGGDAKPIFIDFEEVGHSVLPARFELALFIERAVLVREPDDARAAALADSFLSAYFAGDDNAARLFKSRAVETLQALAARSLCVLADMERNGLEVDDAEWMKFVELYAQASRRAQVFGA